MELGLNELALGKTAKVTKVKENGTLGSRLKDFGLVPGTCVCCQYRAPGGKVTAVSFRGTTVALRTKDLQNIWVQTE